MELPTAEVLISQHVCSESLILSGKKEGGREPSPPTMNDL